MRPFAVRLRKSAPTSNSTTSWQAVGSTPHNRAACASVSCIPGISLNSPRTRSTSLTRSSGHENIAVLMSLRGARYTPLRDTRDEQKVRDSAPLRSQFSVGCYNVRRLRTAPYNFVGSAFYPRTRCGVRCESREPASLPSHRKTEVIRAFLLQPHMARVIVRQFHDQHALVFRKR